VFWRGKLALGYYGDEVAPPQFAIDRQVEHCEVAPARVDLKPGPDIPHFLWLEGTFLTNEAPFVPRPLPLVLLLCVGLGHGITLPYPTTPSPAPSSPQGLEHNARAALKLQTAYNGRSKRRPVASFAPIPDVAGHN
jgi:hypothetical protein